jgi:hypothetical protein
MQSRVSPAKTLRAGIDKFDAIVASRPPCGRKRRGAIGCRSPSSSGGRNLATPGKRQEDCTDPHGNCLLEVQMPLKLAGPHPSSATASADTQAVRILARSFYKELRASGYTPQHLLAVSTQLIELITQDLRKADAADAA